MNYLITKLRLFVFLAVLVMGSQQNCLGQNSNEVLKFVPESAILYFHVPNVQQTLEDFDASPWGKLIADPAMQSFTSELEDDTNNIEEAFLRYYGFTLLHLRDHSVSKFTAVGFPTDRGSLSLTFFLGTENESNCESLQNAVVESLIKADAKPNADLSIDGKTVLEMLVEENQEDLTIFRKQNLLMISGDQSVAAQLIDGMKGAPQKLLADKNQFAAAMASIVDASAQVEWFIDPIPLALTLEEEDGEEEEVPDQDSRPPFPMRHGFPGLKALAGNFALGTESDSFTFRSKVEIIAPPPREGALKIFDFPELLPDTKEVAISSDASVVSRANWNLSALIDNIGDVFDDVSDTDGGFEQTLADYKSELRVDLKADIFDRLGPEILSSSYYAEELGFEGVVVSIAIQDPRKNELVVARAIRNLLIEDTETIRKRVPGKRFELFQMGLTTGDGSMPFSKAGIMVADGRLWLSTHAALIESRLAARESGDIRNEPDFMKAAQISATDQTPIANSFSRTYRDIQYTYKILRESGIEGLENAENLYSTLILKAMEQTDSPADIDFSLLPEYSAISHYFGVTQFSAYNTENGWQIRIFGLPK